MDILGRYYTDSTWSKLLVESVDYKEPSLIVDLGVGGGSLTWAASQKWANASFYGFDVDKEAIAKISKELPFINIFRANTLRKTFFEETEIKVGSVDVAICNPPYLKISNTKKYKSLFDKAKLIECKILKTVSADLIFLAQNLILLKENGVLGIILPDSLLTNYNYRDFRKALLKNYCVEKIIQLPDKIFNKTEARTHILIIKKNPPNSEQIKLYKANFDGGCDNEIVVNAQSLIRRMDFHYHSFSALNINCTNTKPLSKFIQFIRRGNLSYKDLRNSTKWHFHLNCFYKKELSFKNHKYASSKTFVVAKKGDILISRVGKRSAGKVAIVKKGRIAISDCVIIVRPLKGCQTIVWKNLNSNRSKEWMKAASHGVCSQVITIADLLNFPINKC